MIKLSPLQEQALIEAYENGGDCDARFIPSRRTRTSTLNALEAKGLTYSVGMDGSRPLKSEGFDLAEKLIKEKAEARQQRRESEWASLLGTKWEGAPSGNARFAEIIRNVPLEAHAILGMVLENMDYAHDSYYAPLWRPVELRVEEYYEAIGKEHVA